MEKKLKERIAREDIRLVMLDSDGVLIPRGTEVYYREEWNGKVVNNFSTWIVSDRLAAKINKLKKHCIVCICSGRSMIYLQEMYNKVLGGNTILCAENGALFLISDYLENSVRLGEGYINKLRRIKEEIKRLNIIGFEPKQFILTVHAESEIEEVYDIVAQHDPEEELTVMWNGEAFDIQKKSLSKGVAVERLMKEFKANRNQVIAIGDRVNDKEMIYAAGIGVSADREKLGAIYWIDENEKLPGEQLVDMLLDKFGEK